MSDAPTVVRGLGAQNGCFTPEAPHKELARIGLDSELPLEPAEQLTRRGVQLGTASAERIEGQLSDGRFVGWLRVPSHEVALLVKTRDAALRQRILDSATLVAIDPHGCPARRPSAPRPQTLHPSASETLAPERPRSVAVCLYGAHGDRLEASALLTGERALDVARRLNESAPGPNPDADPKQCLHPPAPPPADALLLVEDARGRGTIFVTFSGCTARRLDNGARQAMVSVSFLRAILEPLHTGYGFSGDLPP